MGEIITFYSFKGGTGRTFALVNTGVLLARSGKKKVLLIDWDLDAPGLDRYLEPYLKEDDKIKEGLIDLINEFRRELSKQGIDASDGTIVSGLIERIIEKYMIDISLEPDSSLYYIKAGLMNDKYSGKVQNFKWRHFFKKFPDFFTQFAGYLSERFDYVMIDARTGHTDIGGICTMLMPEKLVLVHTMNNQSIDGVIDIAKKAIEYRGNSNDLRPLIIFPLPSRIDLDEKELHEEWKTKYVEKFRKLLIHCYSLPKSIKVDKYFNNVMIRHSSSYSYGEKIAVMKDLNNGRHSLSQDFKSFIVQIEDFGEIWEYVPFSNLNSPFNTAFIYTSKDAGVKDVFQKNLKPLVNNKVLLIDDFIPPIENWRDQNLLNVSQRKYNILIVMLSNEILRNPKISDIEDIFINNQQMNVFTIPLDEDIEIPDYLKSTIVLGSVKRKPESCLDKWAKIAKEFEQELSILTDELDSDNDNS